MIMPLGQIFGTVSAIGEALGGATRIAEVLSLPQEDEGAEDLQPKMPSKLNASAPVIEFQHVDFTYSSEGSDGIMQTLCDVTLHAHAGEKVAIVGPSGAGKTTILSLIARLYDPTAGTILFRGEDVGRFSRSALRAEMAYVEQGAPALTGTIRDNLTLNCPDVTDEQILNAVAEIHLEDVLGRSPEGLDAEIGEHGVLLSGGERQRLAIARALISHPDVLLLDESTSNLDGINEELVQDLIERHLSQCTRIVVAHRLSTVIDADTILVLDHGRVVAQGNHATLIDSSTVYRDLARTQLRATEGSETSEEGATTILTAGA